MKEFKLKTFFVNFSKGQQSGSLIYQRSASWISHTGARQGRRGTGRGFKLPE
jgi:hypothetical protein